MLDELVAHLKTGDLSPIHEDFRAVHGAYQICPPHQFFVGPTFKLAARH
jgi:hypothetical protein